MRRTVAVVVAVIAVATGCGGQAESRAADPANRRGVRARQPRITPPTTSRLPSPIGIPDDPYAPEPVVQIGTIEIPKIGLTHPVFDGVTLHNIDMGPSHWPGTAWPGQPGNTVFAGHRVTHDHPFDRISELVQGDPVIFTIKGLRTTYLVSEHLVVKPSDTWIANQTRAVTATLYACHPPGSVAERYVVRMRLAT